MFNWVCPQCGKDVPPSKTECPYCAERAQALAAAPPVAAAGGPPVWQQAPHQTAPQQAAWPSAPPPPAYYPAPEPLQSAPPPGYYPPPPPPQYAPPGPGWPQHSHQPQHAPQPQRRNPPPAWLMGIAFALAFIGIFAAVYFGIQRFGKSNPAEKAGLESPSTTAQEAVSNPLQKSVDVAGVRVITEGKKAVATFILVNHSNVAVSDLAGNVNLYASTSRSEEDSVGSFSFRLGMLAANGSHEMSAPLKTKLKVYEMPDWQKVVPDLQITSPKP